MSFVARYGRVIHWAGVAAVPQALFTEQATLGLTPQHIWFVAYILAHRWSTELPHPSLVRMAAHTGYTQRHLHNIKEELVTRGYLRLVARRGAEGGKDTNGYDFSLLLDALSQRLQQAPPALRMAPASPPDPTPPRRRGRRGTAPGVDKAAAALVQPGGAYSSDGGGAAGSDDPHTRPEGGAFSSDRGGASNSNGRSASDVHMARPADSGRGVRLILIGGGHGL